MVRALALGILAALVLVNFTSLVALAQPTAAPVDAQPTWGPLGTKIEPGTKVRLSSLALEDFFGMLPADAAAVASTATVYKKTSWLRVPPGAAGMFLTSRRPGDVVKRGETLGEVVDPISDKKFPIVAPDEGVIIGMVVPTVVYTGDALFHIGMDRADE
jgi:hypothetical protein